MKWILNEKKNEFILRIIASRYTLTGVELAKSMKNSGYQLSERCRQDLSDFVILKDVFAYHLRTKKPIKKIVFSKLG